MRHIIILGSLVFLLFAQAASAGDMCPLGREMASKSMRVFKKDQKKGLAGLIQAQKYCPDDYDISYNLGLAYYKYNRPDLAYSTWKKLYPSNKKQLSLITNLGWLALKDGNVDGAASWADKAIEIKKNTNTLSLKMEILFKQGTYNDAMAFAYSQGSQLPAEYKEKAATYCVENVWNQFRSGQKESATQDMMALAGKYPGVSAFSTGKDKMFAALLDDTVDIPLPKPLPHQQGTAASSSEIMATESDVLNIRSLKETLRPVDNAYALIVGIHKYKHLNGPQFADHDARQVQRMLTKVAGFKNTTAHIRMRRDHEATVGNLYSDIAWLSNKARLNPKAKVVFYFSGHGSPVLDADQKTIKDGLLVPYEATLDNLNDHTAISLAYLNNEFSKIKNNNLVTIIDACFSGSGKSVSGMKLIKPRVDKNLLASKKLFISAAAADRPAEEYTPGRQGAFTYFFLQALMGQGDVNGDNWVDTVEAYQFAKGKLSALGLQQNPQISSQVRLKLAKVR